MTMYSTSPRAVVALAGGRRKVAEACGVTRSAVWQWTRVPSRHLAVVAELSGLAPKMLRPDLFKGAK